MAKRIGSDDAPKVGAKGAGAPAPATNQVVTQESYLAAVKAITQARSKCAAANDELKTIRKTWKASGIELGVLDSMVKMAEWSRGEIRDHFDTAARYAAWLGLPVAPGAIKQSAISTEDDDAIQRREWFALGRTYSRTGKPGRPPEECPDEFHQAFMSGFNEEDEAAWADAEGAQQQEAPVVVQNPVEPTLAEAAVEAMVGNAEASASAADVAPSAEPVAEYAQPSWKGYSDDPEDWFAAQWRDFDAWYEAIPEGANVRMTHKGVLAAFRAKAKAEAEAIAAEDGDDAALGEPEQAQHEPDAYGLGFAACKANEPRTAIPDDLDEAGVAKWLVGWDARAAQEVDKTPAPPPPAKAKARPSKAVH